MSVLLAGVMVAAFAILDGHAAPHPCTPQATFAPPKKPEADLVIVLDDSYSSHHPPEGDDGFRSHLARIEVLLDEAERSGSRVALVVFPVEQKDTEPDGSGGSDRKVKVYPSDYCRTRRTQAPPIDSIKFTSVDEARAKIQILKSRPDGVEICAYSPLQETLDNVREKLTGQESPLLYVFSDMESCVPGEDGGGMCRQPLPKRDGGCSQIPAIEHMVPSRRHLRIGKAGPWAKCVLERLAPDEVKKDEPRSEATLQLPPAAEVDAIVAVDLPGGLCSGVLVAPSVVLTARHCLPAEAVLLGVDVRSRRRSIPILKSIIPPEPDIDAALLFLARDAPGTTPLPIRRSHAPPGADRVFHLGYGLRGSAQTGGLLHSLDLPVTGWGCDARRAGRLGCLPGVEMVVPGGPGVDTCTGDSGGALFEELQLGADARGVPMCDWQLLGITSRGITDGRAACGTGGIYVRADRLAEWIDSALANYEMEEK